MFVNIIIDITHEKLDKIFEYRVPSRLEGELSVGMEVLVPFGKGSRTVRGYVTGFSDSCDYDPSKIKEVLDISPNGVPIEGRLVALAAWIKEHYGGTMIQALKTVLPIKKKEQAKVKRQVRLLLDRKEAEQKLKLYLHKNQRARARLLAALLEEPVQDYDLLAQKLHITRPVIQALEEQKVAALESHQVYRGPIYGEQTPEKAIRLTEEQQAAVDGFWEDYQQGRHGTFLLHGITGSGKTEVYIEMIRRVIGSGRQAIVLIPEIALTFQTLMRFQKCFGSEVAVMHSRLSAGERYDQMMQAKEGKVRVMVGPRSALFTPFPDLGLIVIDEEHEPAYKSEQTPRYHARETAIARAQMEGASVVLGSATPSLEAMYRAKKGEYRLFELKNRLKNQQMARVYVADLREELKKGNRSALSILLQEKMEDRLARKEQMMLFLNRRGYAGFISCRSCGYVARCPHCDVALSYHKGGRLVCHYCGHEEKRPALCPECGSVHVGEFRAGTQQIEDIVKKQFPQARVLRMDMDTTRQKDGHEKILSAFADGEADVLVGTQMIVKGHDFPNVTLVGVLAADLSLYADDYRAGERTFQLLTQAAGRAGRGSRPGEVVFQTYSPGHYAILSAAAQDYAAFYEEEIAYRTLMGYPPVENLLAVLVSCENEAHLEAGCRYLKEYILRLRRNVDIDVIGPASPGIGKINDIYRKVLYLKTERYDTLIKIKNYLERYMEMNPGFASMRVQFDFNPIQIF